MAHLTGTQLGWPHPQLGSPTKDLWSTVSCRDGVGNRSLVDWTIKVSRNIKKPWENTHFCFVEFPISVASEEKKRWKKQNHCRELYTILCSYFPLFISHFCLGVVLIHEILKQPRGANGFPGHTQAVSPRILSRGSIIIVTPRTP